MLGPDVLRYGIKPFIGTSCEYQTAKFGCKGVSSVYTADGARVDCAGYCLKNCKPEELVHMFQPPASARFSKTNADGNKYVKTISRRHWQIYFWKGLPTEAARSPLLTFEQRKGRKLEVIHKGSHRFVTADEASKILCEYIQDMNKRRLLFDYMTVHMDGMEDFTSDSVFIGFNKPWLRPAKDWELQYGDLMLKLQLQ